MQVEFDWVDAFSDQAFAGNGCAVIYHAEDWSVDDFQTYTRETGLVEITAIFPSEEADFEVRYFMNNREIPFAGHPTIATFKSLFDRKLISASAKFQTGAGIIDVRIDDEGWITMQQNAPQFGVCVSASDIAPIYGLEIDEILNEPQYVSTGLPFFITVLKDQNALDRAKLNPQKLAEFQKSHALDGFIEPYLVTLEHNFKDPAATLARLILPPPLPAEDAFTGSATGAASAYLFANNLVPRRYIHMQGHQLNRTGYAKIALKGERNSINAVEVSGKGHILMRGTITK